MKAAYNSPADFWPANLTCAEDVPGHPKPIIYSGWYCYLEARAEQHHEPALVDHCVAAKHQLLKGREAGDADASAYGRRMAGGVSGGEEQRQGSQDAVSTTLREHGRLAEAEDRIKPR